MDVLPPDHAQDSTPSQPTRRTAEEVRLSAQAAGLSSSTGTVGPVQLLHFSPHLHSEEIRLLELNQPILSALKAGDK